MSWREKLKVERKSVRTLDFLLLSAQQQHQNEKYPDKIVQRRQVSCYGSMRLRTEEPFFDYETPQRDKDSSKERNKVENISAHNGKKESFSKRVLRQMKSFSDKKGERRRGKSRERDRERHAAEEEEDSDRNWYTNRLSTDRITNQSEQEEFSDRNFTRHRNREEKKSSKRASKEGKGLTKKEREVLREEELKRQSREYERSKEENERSKRAKRNSLPGILKCTSSSAPSSPRHRNGGQRNAIVGWWRNSGNLRRRLEELSTEETVELQKARSEGRSIIGIP